MKDYLEERKLIIDQALDRLLPKIDEPPSVVHKAMRYATINGGKRIRPILTLAACEAVGGKIETAMPSACAVECIHSFSLIHDDLPCMDDDDFRRGRPTTHREFGEAMALLAGDALFAVAFELVAQTPDTPCKLLFDVTNRLAKAAGTKGMVGGQVMDMLAEGRKSELTEVELIHRRKTGALLDASVVAGGILGGGSDSQVSNLSRYGSSIGLAFQIADDLLNIRGDAEKLGKPVGSDLAQRKSTYPSILGIEESERLASQAVESAIDALSIFDESADPLRDIAWFIVEREV